MNNLFVEHPRHTSKICHFKLRLIQENAGGGRLRVLSSLSDNSGLASGTRLQAPRGIPLPHMLMTQGGCSPSALLLGTAATQCPSQSALLI